MQIQHVGNGGSPGGNGGNARFYKTTNAGTTWTELGATGGSAGFFNGIVFSKTVPTVGIAHSDPPNGSGQPYWLSKTTDGGITWTVTNPPGYPNTGAMQHSVVVIDDQFYGWGSFVAPPAFIVTTDGGTTWNKRIASVTGGLTFLDFKDDKRTGILASLISLPNISRTTDAGVTWATINTGTGVELGCLLKWVNGTNTCYLIGGGEAVIPAVARKSTDGGLTWSQMTIPALNSSVRGMEYKRSGVNVYAYSIAISGAVLKLTDVVSGISLTNSLIPTEYNLEQNYPNPFNPTTTINFSIPISSKVMLKIFDVLGKEVETLVNEFKQAGNYSADFTASSNLTSGVYFYTITAGNFIDTKKLMLVK